MYKRIIWRMSLKKDKTIEIIANEEAKEEF
jgi:hypothetical protein